MTRITAKTILSLLLVAFFASITTVVQAQPVRGVWVNMDRTDPHNLYRSSKKGSSSRSMLSTRSLGSSSSSKASKKKQALKLAKKSRAPNTKRDDDHFQPFGDERLVAPTPIGAPVQLDLAPSTDSNNSKSSEIPSDAPSLVPTVGWGVKKSSPPTVFPNGNNGETVTAPPQDTSRHFDIGPTNQRMLSGHHASPTKTPTTHAPSMMIATSSPNPTISSSNVTDLQGDNMTSVGTKDDVPNFFIPPPAYILLVLATGIAGMATYFENKWRTTGTGTPVGQAHTAGTPQPAEEVQEEGQFVNN